MTEGAGGDSPPNPDLTPWISRHNFEAHAHWFHRCDLIEFYRRGAWFNHWGIYLGNGLVAHVTRHDVLAATAFALTASTTASATVPGLASNSLIRPGLAAASIAVSHGQRILGPSPPEVGRRPGELGRFFVRVDHITTVAGDDEFRVNNVANAAGNYAKRTWPEVFDMVYNFQNNPYTYSVLKSNCEHFATYLRYRYGQGAGQQGGPQTEAPE